MLRSDITLHIVVYMSLCGLVVCCCCFFIFFFNDTATTEIYTLSLHDALPICPDAAIKNLFDHKPCIMTPGKHTSPRAISLVQQLWVSLGMNVIQMPADEHDQKVACVSHLPHAVAAMLVRLADQWDATKIASSGFRDTTRLASGDPTVWTDIFKTNRKQVIKAVDALSLELQQFRKLLVDHANDDLELQLQQCKKMRDNWAPKPEGDE